AGPDAGLGDPVHRRVPVPQRLGSRLHVHRRRLDRRRVVRGRFAARVGPARLRTDRGPPPPPGRPDGRGPVPGDGHLDPVRSDHALVAGGGRNFYGETNVPSPPAGLPFTALARLHASNHCAAMLSDGSVIEWGQPYPGGAVAPALPPGLSWTQIAVGSAHAL